MRSKFVDKSPPSVTLSEPKGLELTEILRFAQDDGQRNTRFDDRFSLQRIALLSFLILALWPQSATAQGKLPPIGQRRYVLDAKDKSAPVRIESAAKGAPRALYLKDPIQPSKDAKVVRPAPKLKPTAVVQSKPRMRPAQLSFARMAVSGRLKRPRVEFDRAALPIGRADEPLADDFFQKVFEPASDDSF